MENRKLIQGKVRSGIILFDLTRVVEELVFNSLDAGATKVTVFIGLGTSYIKVVDDGSGITRDGLVLLGERYVTSKVHYLADKEAMSRSLGFRGEALASISDVSLLEIVTKAYGRANGYRKVMKGCKCLYLGIDDNRTGVGTTVIVRDLFYNQPVRRKIMQSSPKKVFHAVKKRVFRIALVHPEVSFKVIDSESEEEILCTHSSSSPLSLLRSGFGNGFSYSLHELNVDNGILKLLGHISGPLESFAVKALQYVYINSRIVCKGPIHKLLNQLATSFECLDPQKADNGFPSRKRSRSQGAPAYILNLDCPLSLYDLTFEPSKIYVQFKDWFPILTFIEKVVRQFWKQNFTYGESCSHAVGTAREDHMWKEQDNFISDLEPNSHDGVFPDNGQIVKRKLQNHLASHYDLCPPSEVLTKNDDCLFHSYYHKQFKYMHKSSFGSNDQQFEMELSHQINCFSKSPYRRLAKGTSSAIQKDYNNLWAPDNDFSSAVDYVLGNRLTVAERCRDNLDGNILSSVLEAEVLKVDFDLSNQAPTLSCDFHEFSNESKFYRDIKKPLLKSCSSQGRSYPLQSFLLATDEGLEFQNNGIRRNKLHAVPDHRITALEFDGNNQSNDFCSTTLWQDEISFPLSTPRVITNFDIPTYCNFQSKDFVKSITCYGDQFSEENDLLSNPITLKFGSMHQTFKSDGCPVNSDSLLDWRVEHFTGENELERSWMSCKRAFNRDLVDMEEKVCEFDSDFMLKRSYKKDCIPSYVNDEHSFDDVHVINREFCTSIEKTNLHKKNSPECQDVLTGEADSFNWNSLERDCAGTCRQNSQKGEFSYQGCKENHACVERSRRSHSAPPFHRSKRKVFSLDHISLVKAGKIDAWICHDSRPLPELTELKHLQHSPKTAHPFFEQSPTEELLLDRPDMKRMPEIMVAMKETHVVEPLGQALAFDARDNEPAKELSTKETEDSMDIWSKWKNFHPQTAFDAKDAPCEKPVIGVCQRNNKSHDVDNQINILDISLGFLCLVGDSLVPKSLNKNFLEDAKVLQQVDKKFIPVVAGRILSVIDQHAADERIRLEELRRKVLSGEARTITYLDAEQELTLPEIGYQLLLNYSQQLKEWGWICNIHVQDSRSFQKNLNFLRRKATVTTLLAVPCILGTNLSEVDLLEFLHQLADTDGSSTMPPSVIRVLNSKACRGAIMFGDPLLLSECSLIVEELKQTSLCFQCAHGRPTTVPLVNLKVLQKEIRKIGLLNDSSDESWHGLSRQELSLERAARRLSVARG